MSAIASFIKIPKSAINDLREVAASGDYSDFLEEHGEPLADYDWSGYIYATLLCYLSEVRHID